MHSASLPADRIGSVQRSRALSRRRVALSPCCAAQPPSQAAAATVPAAPAPAPAAAPAPAPAPAAAVVPGKISLVVQHASGNPPFVIAGGRMVVRGIVVPYVGGQTVKVSFYRDGRKVEVKTVSVLPVGNGAGQFHLGYSSASAGVVQARAAHYATVRSRARSTPARGA